MQMFSNNHSFSIQDNRSIPMTYIIEFQYLLSHELLNNEKNVDDTQLSRVPLHYTTHPIK